MDKEFLYILEQHLDRYPQMAPQDLGKLAYQSEFGPEHLVSVTSDVVAYLLAEWNAVEPGTPHRDAEPIGNGLCRFYLNSRQDPEKAVPLLAELFARAAKEHKGTEDGLKRRLEQISALGLPGWAEWMENYAAQGYPPLRHSQTYRDAYHPHYRVILEEDALRLSE